MFGLGTQIAYRHEHESDDDCLSIGVRAAVMDWQPVQSVYLPSIPPQVGQPVVPCDLQWE